jgi:inorganic pyrophosphatase
LIISALGIVACFLTSLFATDLMKVNENSQIEATLKYQIIISTFLLTPMLYISAIISLPETFMFDLNGTMTERYPW